MHSAALTPRWRVENGQQQCRGRGARSWAGDHQAYALLRASAGPGRRPDADIQAAVEQRHFDILGTVGIEVQMDRAVFGGAGIEYRAHQAGTKGLQHFHPVQRRLAQAPKALAVGLALAGAQVGAQGRLDLVRIRQQRGAGSVAQHLHSRLLPGMRGIQAMVGDKARGPIGDFLEP